ncbi:hypothetical protein BJ508DRAFT_411469 [Ascobolus immersus RN42]|uniref:Mmc1 C-terminal domain-containing protein n=1 Tax=Ascobolus immersus RN42 TaxID=1160509 RepID=A0A3N4IKX3_ASCIM|nr:hypothetical protein BJ508DRAFT_411469 [Ascobolus immersus RN42]
MRRQQPPQSPSSLPFVCVLCRYMTSSRQLQSKRRPRQAKAESAQQAPAFPSSASKGPRRASSTSTATSISNRSGPGSLAPSSATSVTAPWGQDPTSPLTKALDVLRGTGFADESRINLINHSLERGLDATVRVGVLGGPGVGRFVRILLADETKFGHGEEEWEKRLMEWGTSSSDKKGIIIRYGSSVHFTETLSEPVAYLSIPSRVLKDSKVGILLTSLPDDHIATLEEIHTPTLHMPRGGYASAARTPQMLRYPEHKTLVFNENLDEFLAVQGARTDETVLTVVNVAGLENPTLAQGKSVQVIDLHRAEEALNKLRGKIYSKEVREKWLKEWEQSGLNKAREWVLEGATLKELEVLPAGSIHPVMTKAINSVLSEATSAISKLESPPSPTPLSLAAPSPAGADIPPDMDTPETLGPKIDLWASNAHTELKLDIKNAFESKQWKGLTWWGVLWDSSEVMHTVSTIVYGPKGSNGILATAERSGYELFGRIRGAGFIGIIPPPPSTPPTDEGVILGPTEKKTFPTTTTASTQATPPTPEQPPFSSTYGLPPLPSFPGTITHFRTTTLLSALLPPFVARTSSLITRLLTTSSTLFLISTTLALSTPLSIYSSFSITAFGTALLTARFIYQWEKAKGMFEKRVKKEGIKAIEVFKGGAWGTLGLGRRGGMENLLERCAEGRKAVEDVRRVLRG